MNSVKFKIGDKVIEEQASGLGSKRIGKIINISKKRGDITVDFGNYTKKYNSDGWEKVKVMTMILVIFGWQIYNLK